MSTQTNFEDNMIEKHTQTNFNTLQNCNSNVNNNITSDHPVISSNFEIVANVLEKQPIVPIITIHFAGTPLNALLDTGSSVSLLSSNFFHTYKHLFKYRNLARRVQISTINSSLSFEACVEISFKVEKLHCRHHMYLFNFDSQSSFQALLGYDFIQRFNVVLYPELKICSIKNQFVTFSDNSKSLCNNETIQYNKVLCNDNIPSNTQNLSDINNFANFPNNNTSPLFLHAPANSTEDLSYTNPSMPLPNTLPKFSYDVDKHINSTQIQNVNDTLTSKSVEHNTCDVSASSNCQISQEFINQTIHSPLENNFKPCQGLFNNVPIPHSMKNIHVKLLTECHIQPNDYCYVQVSASLHSSLLDKELLFTPEHSSNNSIFQETLHCFTIKDVQQNTNSNNNTFDTCLINFYVFAQNSLDESLYFPAQYICGQLYEIDHYKTPLQTNSNKKNPNNECINLIVPSPEIIELRRQEFSNAKCDLLHLPLIDQVQIKHTLKTNFAAFSSSLKSMGHTDHITPQIKFINDYPIKTLPFPIPQALQEEAKRQLHEMEEAGIITKNIASWACPMLLVKKKSTDGQQKYRMALDLRLVNTVIEHSSYPLPKIQTIINELAQYKYFTSLDMPAAYHQLELPEDVKDKLSFTTPFGTWRNNRLPFGLKVSASAFQALLDKIVSEVNLPGFVVYQDDVFIGANNIDETIERLDKFLKTFAKYNLTLNLNKCSFHKREINCLGFLISHNKVYPISSNITKITSFPRPTTKRQVKRFLGLCGFYRHLIPSYAELTDPLVTLTSPKVSFHWSEIHQQAFDALQKIFFSRPFLLQPDFNKPFFLNTDASNVAISAVLLQEHNDNLLPVSYFSKGLRNAERNYPAIKLELMAIAKGVKAFRHILYGRQFTILSDAKPLEHYKKVTSPADITTRWLLDLGEYSFNFKHIPGKDNIIADYLSRTHFKNNSVDLTTQPSLIQSDEILPVHEHENVNSMSETINNIEHNFISQNTSQSNHIQYNNNQHVTFQNATNQIDNQINGFINLIENTNKKDPPLQITYDTLYKEQKSDPFISNMLHKIQNNLCTNPSFSIDQNSGLLMFTNIKKSKSLTKPIPRIVVPSSLQQKCIHIYHFPHFGIDKSYRHCAAVYYWRGMYQDFVKYINSCTVCLQAKPHRIPKAPFQNTVIPSRPGEYISLDFVGPFIGKRYILTVVDHFSRHLHLYIMHKISAINTIKAVFDYIVTYGKPRTILSDNGTQFKAHIFKEFCHTMGIKTSNTSLSHPESNSISERLNTSLKSTIKALISEGYTFYNAVKIHQAMYNARYHSTLKTSPNRVHFGREIPDLIESFNPISITNRFDLPNDYLDLTNNLHKLYTKIKSNLVEYQQKQNAEQLPKSKLRKFQIGDTVYLQEKGKLKTIHRGPFKIVHKISDVTFKIQLVEDNTSPILTVHINRLISCPPSRHEILTFPNNRPLGNIKNFKPPNNNVNTHPLHIQNSSTNKPSIQNSQHTQSGMHSPNRILPDMNPEDSQNEIFQSVPNLQQNLQNEVFSRMPNIQNVDNEQPSHNSSFSNISNLTVDESTFPNCILLEPPELQPVSIVNSPVSNATIPYNAVVDNHSTNNDPATSPYNLRHSSNNTTQNHRYFLRSQARRSL